MYLKRAFKLHSLSLIKCNTTIAEFRADVKIRAKTYHYFGMEMNDHLYTSKNIYHSFPDQQRKHSMQYLVATSLHENMSHILVFNMKIMNYFAN